MVIGIGLSISLTPLAGKFWARGEYRTVAGYFQNSIIVNFIVALVLVLIDQGDGKSYCRDFEVAWKIKAIQPIPGKLVLWP